MSTVHANDNKRKLSSDSGESPETKNARHGGSPASVNVIDSIREANCVLLDESITELCTNMSQSVQGNALGASDTEINDKQVSVSSSEVSTQATSSSLDSSESSEILKFLRQIDGRLKNVDGRLESVEKKLQKLDTLDSKVDAIDKDVTKLWNFVQDNFTVNEERINKCEDDIDEIRFALGKANENIDQLTQTQSQLNDELDYIRSQSMRNNLVFCNVPESKNEKPSVTESKVRELLSSSMGIETDIVKNICIERAHRSTHPPQGSSDADFTYDVSATSSSASARKYGPPCKPRAVIVKFASYKDREMIRSSSKNLKGTCYYVHEQFPKSVSEKRRKLLPRLKAAQQNGQRAWLSYDKLYIDGVVQPEEANTHDTRTTSAEPGVARGSTTSSGRGRGGQGGRDGQGSRGGGRGGGHRGGHQSSRGR